jgi:hypothetical protein
MRPHVDRGQWRKKSSFSSSHNAHSMDTPAPPSPTGRRTRPRRGPQTPNKLARPRNFRDQMENRHAVGVHKHQKHSRQNPPSILQIIEGTKSRIQNLHASLMHTHEWRRNLPGGKMQRKSTVGERRNSGELVLLLRPHDAEARSEFCVDRKARDPPNLRRRTPSFRARALSISLFSAPLL